MPLIRGSRGISIHVYDPNPAGKEAVVFLHGWPLNQRMFEYQFHALSEYRCIGVDMRGFGLSEAPIGGYDYDTFADDLAAVVRRLGLRQFTLAGFSMGGAVALRYMSRYRGAGVKKIAFLSAAAPIFTKRDDFPYGQDIETVTRLISDGLANRPLMLENFSHLFLKPETDGAFRHWFTLLCLDASAVATIGGLYMLRDSDLRGDTRHVNVPAGIFHGKLDQVCPFELGEQLHQMIPDSELFAFEESGHCIFHDELEEFNRKFTDFLKK